MQSHVVVLLIFWWQVYWWHIDVLTCRLLFINFCVTKGKYLVDIDERLKLCLLNIDAKLMKCWLVLIYCLCFDGVHFESGAPADDPWIPNELPWAHIVIRMASITPDYSGDRPWPLLIGPYCRHFMMSMSRHLFYILFNFTCILLIQFYTTVSGHQNTRPSFSMGN